MRACLTCALSRLQLTFTDNAFLLAGSATAAAVPTLCGSVSGPPVVPLPADLTAANVRCLDRRCNGLTTTAVAVYIQATCSISVTMRGLGSRGITPYLCVHDAVRPTFWDLDMFPWTFPSDISPDNHCLK